ncbi:calcium-activated chloride channel regulator family member 3-like [Diadema setosum]|uniref:calcium-activated chloride channel regulator family member 3-like n=1 Tax=Diadema setosum TaxID=31175 RepID=UPI003B3ABDDF
MATIQLLVFCLTVLFAISSVSSLESSSRVYLNVTDRGYQDLLIAIQPGVSESDFPQLLDEIKEAFTAASRQLYVATRRFAYFKTVRILVPADWADSADYQQVTWETYDTSDVRISSDANDQPQTQQPGQCGEPGMYMRLSPSYLTNPAVTDRYGSPGQVIVHEWAHLRYGVFDEHANPGDINDHEFYTNPITDEVEATRCAIGISEESSPYNMILGRRWFSILET